MNLTMSKLEQLHPHSNPNSIQKRSDHPRTKSAILTSDNKRKPFRPFQFDNKNQINHFN